MNLPCLSLIAALLMTLPGQTAAGQQGNSPPPAPATQTSSAELKQLDAADDAAQTEVDRWTSENTQKRASGAGLSEAELQAKITERFEPVRKAYDAFVKKHPDDARGHIAYGNFLMARDDELGAQKQWEEALRLDPQNADMYNSLAGRYSESGPVEKAFSYFTKAIELSPRQAAYYHNFANVLYVRRKQAATFYGLTEQGVYARALLLYSNAMTLDSSNFTFAHDYAETYYSVKPLPIEPALKAWTNASKIARNELDREDACVHLARVKMLAGRFDQARAQLIQVTNETWMQAKTNLLKNIQDRESRTLAAPQTLPGHFTP